MYIVGFSFVRWRDEHFLDCFKEMEFIVNLTMHTPDVPKYLGTIFFSQLEWDACIDITFSRSHQRLYLLRIVRCFFLSPVILPRFYQSFVENPSLCFCVSWLHDLSVGNRNSLVSLVNICSQITGIKQGDWFKSSANSSKGILHPISHHVLACEFSFLPSIAADAQCV